MPTWTFGQKQRPKVWILEQSHLHTVVCFQSLMVAKAKEELDQEVLDKEEEKQRYLMENIPPLQTQGMSFAELQVTMPPTKLTVLLICCHAKVPMTWNLMVQSLLLVVLQLLLYLHISFHDADANVLPNAYLNLTNCNVNSQPWAFLWDVCLSETISRKIAI